MLSFFSLLLIALACVLLLGIVRCALQLTQPETNLLGASALLISLVAGAAFVGMALAVEVGWLPAAAQIGSNLCIALAEVIAAGLAIGSIAAGVKSEERHTSGRGMAWSGASFSLLVLALVSYATFSLDAAWDRNVANKGPAELASNRLAVDPSEKDSQNPDGNASDDSETAPPPYRGDAEFVFEDLNYAYDRPKGQWTELRPGLVNPDASIVLLRARPQAVFMIIAEKIGDILDSQALADIAEARLRSASVGATVNMYQKRTIAGIRGYALSITANVDGKETLYRNWAGVRNGYAYQLLAYASGRDALALDEGYEELIKGFQLIDPDRVYYAAGQEPIGDYESLTFNYRFQSPEKWRKWNSAASDLPVVDYGAKFSGEKSVFAVVPLPLQGKPADMETLANVLLGSIGLTYPGPDVVQRKQVELKDSPLIVDHADFDGTTISNGMQARYRARCLQTDQCAYLLVGWTVAEDAAATLAITQAFERFEPLPGKLPEFTLANSLDHGPTGELINQLGLQQYHAGEYDAAAKSFRAASKILPEAPVILGNLVDALLESEGAEAALQAIDEQLASGRSAFAGKVLRGRLLMTLERNEEAIEAFTAASQESALDDDSLLAMANCAVDQQRFEEAIQAFQKAKRKRKSADTDRWYANLLLRAGRQEEALAELLRIIPASPEDDRLKESLAAAYLGLERYKEALEVVGKMLRADPNSLTALTIKAQILIGSEQFDQAKQVLSQILVLAPGDLMATELLAEVSALLGRGDNRRIREEIEPVTLPPAIASRLNRREPLLGLKQSEQTETGIIELSRVKGFFYQPGKATRSTLRRSIYVVDQRGVEAMKTMQLEFDPLRERLYVNELVVRDAEGQQIGKGELEDYYVLDNNSSGMDTYGQVATLPVPMVRVGCTIELTVTRETLSSSDEFGFETHAFSSMSPIQMAVLYIRGEVDKLAYRSNGPKAVKSVDLLSWFVETPTPLRLEPLQRPVAYYLPLVWINDAQPAAPQQQWAQLGADYYEELLPTLETDDKLVAVAQQLTQGKTTRAEQVAAIARYVQEELSYTAIEFGVRSYVPHAIAQIRRKGAGDCKDHALLTHHLLRAIAIPSQLALVNTGEPVVVDLPSLDQFDHMVVVLPAEAIPGTTPDTIRVIDATQKNIDPLLAVPAGLAGRQLLVLDEEQSKLVRAGQYPTDAASIACDRLVAVQMDESGDEASIEVDETITLSPYAAASMRSALRSTSKREQEELFQRLLGENSGVELNSIEVNNLTAIELPLEIRLNYSHAGLFQPVAGNVGKLVGRLPCHWTNLYVSSDRVRERTTPFEFEQPTLVTATTKLRTPPGFRIAAPQQPTRTQSLKTFQWQATSQVVLDGAEMSHTIRRPSGHFSAADYAAYDSAVKRVARQISRPVVLERSEAPRRLPQS